MKFTSLLFLGIISSFAFGQNPCSMENVNGQTAFGSTNIHKNTVSRAVIDIDVLAEEEFSLNAIEARILSNSEVVSVDISIFSDNNGLPGTELETITDLSPTSNAIVGTTFGTSARLVVLEFPEIALSGNTSGTKYWLEISASGQDVTDENVSWEISAESVVGSFAQSFSNGNWQVITFNTGMYEGVYKLNGACKEAVGNNVDLKIYPNPTVDWIHIEANVNVSEIRLIELSGRIIENRTVNDKVSSIDISRIGSNVIIAQIFMEDGSIIIKRIVKG